MLEKVIGIIAMLGFLVFAGYITAKVNEPELWIVFVVVAAMAIYDFYLDIFRSQEGNGNGSSG